ncbi:MAG: Unknown protein [uncultured Sulfurovum sp.]|uniref:CRISPR-associated protein, TM1802 family n=1 Tax=uncultured Sulfurovum sp. TaxID=269237 RepID=A0A6S6T8B5_9BACT|nr:MAG: Unknown protein [uncultured Sulfurovum sp.]
MADLVKTFYAYGKYFEDDLLESFNQFSSKKIDKILHIEVNDYSYSLKDASVIRDRLILYITSSAGGNLFPFIFLSEKLFDIEAKGKIKKGAIVKSFENMRKYLTKEELQELEPIYSNIDFERLQELVELEVENKNDLKENWYIALSFDGLFFNERFPNVFNKMIEIKGSDISLDGHCFIDASASKIGFDVGLNFCSTNELSNGMAKKVKPRLLPVSNEAGRFVKLGFEKIFNDFKFKLFGLNYILLPTVFKASFQNQIFTEINRAKKTDFEDKALEKRVLFEIVLELIVERIHKLKLTNELLFTMLFYEKNNKEIVVSHTIEDIVPSRIAQSKKLMKEFSIDASNLSKYHKKVFKENHLDLIYIRDYINDKLFLAKLLFGKERLSSDALINSLYHKIIFGNGLDKDKRELSKIINGYYRDDTNFYKHQKLIEFLSSERLNALDYIELGGCKMEFKTVEELVEWKYANVDLLKGERWRQREFFILGMLSKLVINWHFNANSEDDDKKGKKKQQKKSSFQSYLDTIGTVNTLNIEGVFRKLIDGVNKYDIYSENYDYLLTLYIETKSRQQENEKLSNDKANILFIMGSMDYKNLTKKENN